MAKAKSECSHYQEFDYVVINNDFELALIDLNTIINNQRLKQTQQTQQHKELFVQLLAD